HDKVTVNTYYTRSINLERDTDSVDIVSSYIPTSRAIRTLERISETFTRATGPRAWSLIGPYGSGKSSFSVFLSQLLTGNTEAAITARRILRKDNRALAAKYSNEVNESAGYLKILITGSPEPLAKRLVQSLYESALKFWESRRGPNNIIVDELAKATKKRLLTTTEVMYLVKRLQTELTRSKGESCKGIIIIIDELGKFLEYEARHHGKNDIYLLQALAEHALKGHSVNFLLFVMLHQSFDQYTKGLGENLKNEWTKIQGRFEDIPFVEAAEQVLRIVGAAFTHKLSSPEDKKLHNYIKGVVKVFRSENAMPGALTEAEAVNLFKSCYPLHPVTALLLPMLCQKVAQNERTLFSYLGSHEEHGLQSLLTELKVIGDWVYPHHIYDYFIANQPSILGDHITHRRWAEVITALERLGDATEKEEHLLKSIGVLNIIGSKGGFKASGKILELCVDKKKEAKDALVMLKRKSIITHRRFNNEYRVWQGSDFDLDDALQAELDKIGRFNLADELNNRQYMLPVVARKYTIKYGALRYFEPYFIDVDHLDMLECNSENPRLLFYLVQAQDDIDTLYSSPILNNLSLDLVAICLSSNQIREITAEVKGLENVEAHYQELNSDPVARHEFQDRLSAASLRQEQLLQQLIENPAHNEWIWLGEKQTVHTRRDLQHIMSEILTDTYSKAPVFHNELINRNIPSSQAAAGRKRLLSAMLSHPNEPELGIDKYPPEKAMYLAILKENGLHKKLKNNQWEFAAPDKTSTVYPVWKRIKDFLDTTEKTAKSFIELSNELRSPPYGVKDGVLPILYTTVLLVYQHELAVYENRRYIPHLNDEILERFVKRPDEFAVQLFRIQGLRASIFDQYSHALFDERKATVNRTVLDFAKQLAKFIYSLEEYTQKTRSSDLSVEAKLVRDAFSLAKSPDHLLFNDLPLALGYDIEKLENGGEAVLEGFSTKLMDCMRELKHCFGELLTKQKELLAQAFHVDNKLSLKELHQRFAGRYKGLEQHTVDVDGLKVFLKKLTKSDCETEEW
ncbi:MAG TPA: hypothetical protein VGA80_07535, partial [Flavobacteriaceae bacterium]